MTNKNTNDSDNTCKIVSEDEIDLIMTHKYTTEQKLKWFGYGEWIEEPDEIQFYHEGYFCRINRVVKREPCVEEHMFGGHLCGYILIPSGHPWLSLEGFNIDCEVYGGISWFSIGLIDDSDDVWAGFDCGHSGDLIPSMQAMKKQIYDSDPFLKNIREQFPEASCRLFDDSYKNIQFVINETKKLAEQAKEAMNELDSSNL